MASTKNYGALHAWLTDPQNRVYWNEEAVEVRKSPLGGLGVFAKKQIDKDQLLLRIAKTSILSGANSCVANLLYDATIDGMLALVLAFLYERAAGKDSPWAAYIDSFDFHEVGTGRMISPPALWDDECRALLEGTDADIIGVLDPTEIQAHYTISLEFAKINADTVEPPYELTPDVDDPQEENEEKYRHFVAVYFAVASRSFVIDDYQQLALVPGADLYNHRELDEDVHFVAVAQVCPFCGDSEACAHDEYGPPDSEEEEYDREDLEEQEEEVENEEMSDDDEAEDVEEAEEDVEIEGEEKTERLEDGSEQDSEEEKEEEGDDDDDEDEEHYQSGSLEHVSKLVAAMEKTAAKEKKFEDAMRREIEEEKADLNDDEYQVKKMMKNPDQCCDITAFQAVAKGKELFNTYGDLSSALLLAKYGFVAPVNPHDKVCLGRQVAQYLEEHEPSKVRLQWWTEDGLPSLHDYRVMIHEQEHEQGQEHGDDDDDDDDDDMDDDDDENAWLTKVLIDVNGEPVVETKCLANILTMSDSDFETLVNSDAEGFTAFVESRLSKEASRLLLKFYLERADSIEGYTSAVYTEFEEAKLTDPRKVAACTLISNELRALGEAIQKIRLNA